MLCPLVARMDMVLNFLNQASMKLSLSPMTLPHGLARVFFNRTAVPRADHLVWASLSQGVIRVVFSHGYSF